MSKREFAERLSELRCKKDISARDMSLSLGRGAGYINSIENCKTYPSMENFFDICDFFEITPREFFDKDDRDPDGSKILFEKIKRLDGNQSKYVRAIIDELTKKK